MQGVFLQDFGVDEGAPRADGRRPPAVALEWQCQEHWQSKESPGNQQRLRRARLPKLLSPWVMT